MGSGFRSLRGGKSGGALVSRSRIGITGGVLLWLLVLVLVDVRRPPSSWGSLILHILEGWVPGLNLNTKR